MADLDLTVAKLRAIFSLDSAEWESGIRTVSDSAKTWERDLTSMGRQATDLGQTMTAAITLPIAGIAIAATKFAIDFESAMVKVETLSGVSAEAVKEMEQAVLALAPAVGIGPTALAEGLLVITSTGLRGAEAMQILEAAAKASAVGLGEVNDIARAMTAAITAYGKENLTAADAANKLFVAVREGGAEASGFARTLGDVVGIAAQMGVSFDEVLASVATFTRLGIGADEAVTALRQTLTNFLSPAEEVKKALESIGLSADDIRRKIREDGLAATLQELIKAFEGNDDALGKLLPNVKSLAGVLGTAGSQGEAYREILDKISRATKELDDAFARASETGRLQWNQFLAQGEALLIRFGQTLEPVFLQVIKLGKDLLAIIEPLVAIFASLPQPVQLAAIALVGIVTAAGPLLIMLGQMAIGASAVAAAFTEKGIATRALTLLLPPLQSAASGIGAAFTTAGIGVGALTAAMAGIVVPLTLIQLHDLIVNIKGLLADKEGWDIGAKGEFDTHARAMAEASKIAGTEITNLDEAMRILNTRIQELQSQSAQANGQMKMTSEQFAAWRTAAGLAGDATKELGTHSNTLVDQLEAMRVKVAALTVEEKAQIDAGMALGLSVKDISTATHLSEEVIRSYTTSHKEATKATDEHREAIEALVKQIGGSGFVEAATRWMGALKEVGGLSALSAADLKTFEGVIRDVADAIARGGPEIQAALKGISTDVQQFWITLANTAKSDEALQGMRDFIGESSKLFQLNRQNLEGLTAEGLIPATNNWKEFGMALATATPAVLDAVEGTDKLRAAAAELAKREHIEALNAFASGFSSLGSAVGGDAGSIITSIGGLGNVLSEFAGVSDGFLAAAGKVATGVMNVWQATSEGSTATRVLNGALEGMAAGFAIGGPWGAAVGAAAGAITGWIRASQDAREEMEKLREQATDMADEWIHSVAEAFEETATSMQMAEVAGNDSAAAFMYLQTVLADFGMTADQVRGLMAELRFADTPEEVEAVLNRINALLEDHADIMKHWAEGISMFSDGLNLFAEGFEMRMERVLELQDALNRSAALEGQRAEVEAMIKALDAMKASGTASQKEIEDATVKVNAAINKLKEDTDKYHIDAITGNKTLNDETVLLQQQFDALGLHALQAFSLVLSQSGSLLTAFDAIGPSLDLLIKAQKDLGFEGSEAIQKLLRLRETITANEDVMTSLEGLVLMMDGLSRAALLTKEDVDLFGKDAVTAFDTLKARSVPTNEALLLMQPTLQKLWEAQQKFGEFTDLGTQALINQALQAGLVGPGEKTIFENIHEALLGIEGAILRLPEAFVGAIDAARTLRDTLRQVQPDTTVLIPDSHGRLVPVDLPTREEFDARWARDFPGMSGPSDAAKRIWNQKYIDYGYEPIFPEVMPAGFVPGQLTPVPAGGVPPQPAPSTPASPSAPAAPTLPPGTTPTMPSTPGGVPAGGIYIAEVCISIGCSGNADYDGEAAAMAFLRKLEQGGDLASLYRRVHHQLVDPCECP